MEAVPIGTRATLIGWGLQAPLAIPRPDDTKLKGINVSVIDCGSSEGFGRDVSWVKGKWKNHKSKFICTETIAGGGCHGDSGGM